MTDPGDEHQSNDIVDRLRRMSNGLTPRSESDLMLEAAAEILRLRIEVQLCRRILPRHIERVMYEGEG
jgi:hypothetical protein